MSVEFCDCPCAEGFRLDSVVTWQCAADCRPLSSSVFSPVRTQEELYHTHLHVFTVKPFSTSNAEKSTVISQGSVSTVVRASNERLVSLQQSDKRKLIVAEDVRHPRQNGSRGTSGTFLGSFAFCVVGRKSLEHQVAALMQQVMEMTERTRQREEAAEQTRRLLEAHRNAGQMLEERMSRAEAAATAETSPAGGMGPGRAQVPD